MYLEIFDVEHGACALINTSNGKRVMIDCGHNAATNWRPGYHLSRFGINFIDRLYVTNFDEDHVSGFPNLSDYVRIGALFTNPTVAPSTVRYLKTEDGMGVGIERLVLCMEHVFTGGRPPAFEDYGDTSFTAYWNQYGLLGFTDENNLSLVVFVTCGQHKFIFPGDMESEGWRQLLRNPAFVAELHGVNVFVASHHGRENGYCEEVLNLCPAIEVFIISDKKMGYQSQETVDRYRAYARGFNYQGDIRHVLTTRRERRKREKLFEALLHQLEALAREKPVLMIFEDVHWLDPTSRELLDLTMDRAQRVPVLLIVTFRPEFQPPWGDQSHVTMLRLNRLGGGATARRFLSALRVEDQTTI